MPRNFSKYQYETSPRKLEPEYTPVKNPYKKKKTTARKVQTTNKNKVNEIKKRKMGGFVMKTDDKDKLWKDYKSKPTQEIREQLIIEYAQLVKIVAGRLSMYLGYNVEYESM